MGLVYLPTFTIKSAIHVGKYTIVPWILPEWTHRHDVRESIFETWNLHQAGSAKSSKKRKNISLDLSTTGGSLYETNPNNALSQMLNVWPIYLHLGSFGGKCRYTIHWASGYIIYKLKSHRNDHTKFAASFLISLQKFVPLNDFWGKNFAF